MHIVWRGLLVVVLVLLGACSTITHDPQLGGNIWTGRLLVRTLSSPPQAFSAGFVLEGQADRGQLSLLSPIGTTVSVIRWDGHSATWQHDRQTTAYPDINTLMQQATGSVIPIGAIFATLNGEQGSSADGWTIDASQLPQNRLHASRQASDTQAAVEVRIVLDR